MSANLLRGTRTYLCGHMEYGNGEGWRNEIKKVLNPMGVTCFDPYHKPFINERPEDEKVRAGLKQMMMDGKYDEVADWIKEVRCDDLRLVDISDFLIVGIDPKIPSWGTPEELYWGNREKKPIFLFIEGGKKLCPLWLMGTIPHKYIYDNHLQVIDMLKNIDSGAKPLDNGRWRLLREEYR